jgi:stage III sporulation protein AF
MLGELKTWIISICTVVIFITAVEMLLPNNGFRKYVKFVLGLILITVLINPILKVFDRGFDINKYVAQAVTYVDEKGYESSVKDYKKDTMSNTLSTFKLNIEKACEVKLKENFPNSSYNVEATVDYEKNNDSAYVKSLKVGIKDGSIDKIKKVEITTKGNVNNSSQTLNDERSRLVKEFLSKELKLQSASIEIYKD